MTSTYPDKLSGGRMVRVLRVVALAAALAIGPALVSAACSHSDDHTHGAGGAGGAGGASASDPCSNGAYLLDKGLTDEACRTFSSNEKVRDTDASKAPTWSSPKDGATLPRGTPATFSWAKGATARAPLWRELLHELDPLKHAYAHGDTTGDGYSLSFEDASGREVLRAMTTSTSWTPDAASWAKLVAGTAVRARLVWARFVKNDLAAGTKPAEATPLSFSIGT